ncbi:hypothetical protein [Paenibacillus thiaminolyticus]|uniref:hypothetical protein n=1 Tax=Paenibacillus thiaminolyticus TaxID=49283 RepID=UPI002542AAA7|nr:hypothetical protein [Paenibacillus thiaminolyticus]WII40567.1 hypothetical protein O0V01_22880 [Paenibacillus thiaminolyticus]
MIRKAVNTTDFRKNACRVYGANALHRSECLLQKDLIQKIGLVPLNVLHQLKSRAGEALQGFVLDDIFHLMGQSVRKEEEKSPDKSFSTPLFHRQVQE